jgi:hypothetical protein
LTKKIARVVDGRSITPLEAAALILGKLKHDAEVLHFNRPVTRAVITCPAAFDEVEKDQLREAARRAGVFDVALLEEPVAAADAYTRNGIEVGRHVLVYDLGGGTFDLAWLAREEGEDEFRLAMEPRGQRIGGEDFDRAIYNYFEARVREQKNQPICPDGLDLDLLHRCRKLKETLSVSEQTAQVTWRGHGIKLTLRLNRSCFEDLVENHVELTVRLTQSIQADAKAAGCSLESLILIGGASRTPCIIKRLQQTLQVEPRRWEKQDLAVALGAAYHAQRLWGEKPKPTPPPESGSSGTKPAMAPSAANSAGEFERLPAAKSGSLAVDEESPPEKTAMPQTASDEIVTVNLVVDFMGHAFTRFTLFEVLFDDCSLDKPSLVDAHLRGKLRDGCDVSFTTTQGDHTLQVAYGGFWGMMSAAAGSGSDEEWKPTKTKTYTVSFREGGAYRITLQAKSGFLSANPSFADEVQQVRLGGADVVRTEFFHRSVTQLHLRTNK